jgi:hypothetical protein
MNKREIGQSLNLERLSGRLFFQPVGTVGFLDMGDVMMHKYTPDTETATGVFHTRAATTREVRRDTTSSTQKWEVQCQEHNAWNEAFILSGIPGNAFSQAAITVAATKTFADVPLDRYLDIGKLDVHTVTATKLVGDVTATAATDIIALNAHGLPNGAVVQFTNAGGALPAGLVALTNYFVRDSNANDFKVSATVGGAEVDITGAGTGTHSVVQILSVGELIGGTLSDKLADVIVDKALGMVLFRSAGSVKANDDIVVSYKANAVDMETVTEVGEHAQHHGSFRLVGFDGQSEPARNLYEFDGQMSPTERGEHSVEGVNNFTFEIVATGNVSVKLGNQAA